MAVINRSDLLDDIYLYLPDENILTESQIVRQYESVISKVGDDDVYYDEVVCKTLRVCALANKAKAAISGGSVRREKSHGREIEFFDHSADELWDRYVDSLADLCPLLPNGGYNLKANNAFGLYGNVGDLVTVPEIYEE